MGTIIRTENVNRDFISGGEAVHALKNINITIEAGSFNIIRGRSGSGKTTLMNLLGAIDQPSSGKIYIDDQEITHIPEHKRDTLRREKMGFVFQSVALISLMSALENVEFSLSIAGIGFQARKDRAEEYLQSVGLQKRMHHRPYELSGGEQQRVAIARAVAHAPKLLFADEPTAELDTTTGLHIVKIFKDFVESRGLTVIMTTHDPGMIEVADYVFTLEDGEIVDE